MTEHWLDRALREKWPWESKEPRRAIACPGNYIKIPAKALIIFQQIRNKGKKRKLSLIEQQREWEKEQTKEGRQIN